MYGKLYQDKEEILKNIRAAKEKLGRDLVVLAHYYQNDDIITFADFVGDSLQLARDASMLGGARYIVFCAVSFMAEMARILCSPDQMVFHPEAEARCPLAEMADIFHVEKAWTMLERTEKKIIPVVYVNSNADLKAFCGKNGGLVCTSANARNVMEYVLSGNGVPFFFPDENLGKNTARTMGISEQEMFLWDPHVTDDKMDEIAIKNAKVFLWKGFCIVHATMLPSHVEEVRKKYSGIKVIVHPECIAETVNASDMAGSTSFIKNTIEKSEAGSKWAIGTEINFVNRLKKENPDKLIVPLLYSDCLEMSKITPEKLLYVLENLVEGKEDISRVLVDKKYVKNAKLALDRMLEIG